MHENNYDTIQKRFIDTQKEVSKLYREMSDYKYKELLQLDESQYQVYLNKLHKDFRCKMEAISYTDAVCKAKMCFEQFKQTMATLSCIRSKLER